MKGKFIGQRVIESVEDYSDEAKLVIFVDGSQEIISNILLEKTSSDEPRDETSLRDLRVTEMALAVLQLLTKYNMKLSEFEQLAGSINMSISDSFNKASVILWGVETKSILDVDRVLKSNRLTLKDIIGTVDK